MSAATATSTPVKLYGAEKEAQILAEIRNQQAQQQAPTWNLNVGGSFFNFAFNKN